MVFAMKALRRLTVRAALPDQLAPLGEIVANLRWSWHPETQDVFASINPALWTEVNHDPVRLLGEVSPERLAEFVMVECETTFETAGQVRSLCLPRSPFAKRANEWQSVLFGNFFEQKIGQRC